LPFYIGEGTKKAPPPLVSDSSRRDELGVEVAVHRVSAFLGAVASERFTAVNEQDVGSGAKWPQASYTPMPLARIAPAIRKARSALRNGRTARLRP
jgi:hypothetical protein